MKTLTAAYTKVVFLLLITTLVFNTTQAQHTRKEKKAQKLAELTKAVNARQYTFKAEYANPMRGGNRALTSEYDMVVRMDSIIVYLPYFGRAYVAPIDPTKGGIQFTSTKFEYTAKQKKSGSWEISIVPKDERSVQKFFLTITQDGYATLQVTNSERDPISFQGYIEPKQQKM